VVLIQWHSGNKKCYFSLVPTSGLNAFRAMDAFEFRLPLLSAHEYIKFKTKDYSIAYMWLRKPHYNVIAGRAKSATLNAMQCMTKCNV
jgi:hypothetical protein